ncbi:MAG: NUDIX hydrolase [Gemmatimonadetes bacterium]|nr:NUDIX hydrolase [Gemmatimonadota bacterium]MDE3259981.1 NUDIX hydrolase [Gemmatimonadota bacterium]
MASDHNAHHPGGVRFCERCSKALVLKPVEGHSRPVCPACGFVVYLDPKVAAGVIVTLEDEVVLLKRGIEPGIGKWVFPGGYVDRGEQVEAAAAREAMEEVGLEVEIEDLLGVYSYPSVTAVLVVYTGIVVGGELKGNFEALEVRTYPPGRIPWSELAFRSTAEALRAWLAQYAKNDR